MTGNGFDTMWFLPIALNVKVKKFNYARVNGGSIYDSLRLFATLREKCDTVMWSKSKKFIFRQHNQIAGKSQ